MYNRMKDLDLPVELIVWEGALHAAHTLSKQSARVNAVHCVMMSEKFHIDPESFSP